MPRSRTLLVTSSLAASLVAVARPANAQTLDALRAGPSPLGALRSPPGPKGPSLPSECQKWIGTGIIVGGVAGLVATVVTVRQTARRGGEGTIALPALAPILGVLYIGGGAAVGALAGYAGCAVYYSVRPPEASEATSWRPLTPATRFGTIPIPP